MTQIAIKDFSSLRSAVKESGLKLAAAPRIAPRKDVKKPASGPAMSSKKPVLPASVKPEDSIGKLFAITDAAFAARGLAGVMAFADHAVLCLAEAEIRKNPGLPAEKSVIRALEGIVLQCGVPNRGHYTPATRGRRLIQMLEETPAVVDGQMVRIDRNGEFVPVEHAKEAASALAVYEAVAGELDKEFIKDLEISKATKADSLRDPRMKKIRRTVPDLGAALVAAGLLQKGFTPTGLPVPNFVSLNFNALNWAVKVLADLREVLSEEDETLRGWLFVTFVEGDLALDYEQFGELSRTVAEVSVGDGASAATREKVRARYEADKAKYDEVRAQWNALQSEFDDIQQEAINAVDEVLAFLRFKLEEKEWIANERQAKKGEKGQRPEKSSEPRVVKAAPRTKTLKESTATPAEAIAALTASGVEVETEISLPTFNAEVLGIAQVALRKEFAAAGVDGGRECPAYPGVVWEAVVGPVYHAMDLDKTEADCRIVVIAPRRPGAMGLDMSEARALMVVEYEDYFSPVDEE